MEYIISHKSVAALVRTTIENQDSYGIYHVANWGSKNKDIDTIIAVSDGMGGLNDPAEASYLAVKNSINFLLNLQNSITSKNLATAIVKANDLILGEAKGRDLGATLTLIHLSNDMLQFSHIGDCRLFLIRNGEVKILTEDHTKLAKKLGITNPSLKEVKENPASKKLSKSLGEKEFTDDYLQSTELPIILKNGDTLILCTDGVWTELEPLELQQLINENPYNAANNIISTSVERDNTDDSTVIVVKAV